MVKKNIFNFIIFFITCFFIVFLFQTLKNGVDLINENNSLRRAEDKLLNISGKDVSFKNLKNEIESLEEVKLEKDGIFLEAFVGKSIYSNLSNPIIPSLIEGRFFTKEDFNEDKIVIGKNMSKLIKKKNGKEYVSFLGKDREVIGIMGSKNRMTAFDDTFYINDLLSDERIEQAPILISGKNVDKNIEVLKNMLKKVDESVVIDIEEINGLESPLGTVVYRNKYIIIIAVLLIGTLLLNIVNTTNYYILNKKKEIGIKKLLGRNKLNIGLEIIFEYIKIAIYAFITSTVFYNIIIFMRIFPKELGLKFDLIIGLFALILMMILAIIVAIPSIIKSNRISISSIIKEE